MYIVGCLLGTIVLTLIKCLDVRKKLGSDLYSKRNFALFSSAWFLWTLPGLYSICNEVACRRGFRFTWMLSELSNVIPLDRLDPSALITIAVVSYMMLTVYFLGHCIGWLLYLAGRLLASGAGRPSK